jgi:uncharacterized integral membrane protein
MQDHEPGRTPSPPRQEGLTKAEIRWIIGGVLAIVFGIFIAQNATEVKIHFVFFSANIRLIWVFLICAVLGAVIDRLLQRRGLLPATRRNLRKHERRDATGQ